MLFKIKFIGLNYLVLASGILIFFTPLPSFADLDERYHLSIGVNIETYDTNLSVNTNNDKGINIEDGLGLNRQVNAGWINGWYRVGDNHRIMLTYTPVERSALIQNNKDIVFDNTTIKAGATVSSKTSTDILDFSYIYSMYHAKQVEVGLSLGIYWLLNSTSIVAAGEIIAEGENQPAFKADYFSKQKLQAPMPLLGISATYEFSPSWRSHAAIRYLNLQIDEVFGRILSADLGTEYYFNNNLGVGLSLSYFDLDVEVIGLATNTLYQWKHNGVQIYGVFKY